jgi:hypothetical protein
LKDVPNHGIITFNDVEDHQLPISGELVVLRSFVLISVLGAIFSLPVAAQGQDDPARIEAERQARAQREQAEAVERAKREAAELKDKEARAAEKQRRDAAEAADRLKSERQPRR